MTRNPLRLYFGLHRDIYVLFTAQLVNAMGSFVFPFLTLLLVEKLRFSPGHAGLILLVTSAANITGGIVGGRLSDRFGRKPVIVTAQLLVVLLYLSCALLGKHLVIVPFIIAAELALGAVGPATNALVADRAPRDRRQASFSLIYLGFNLGFAVGLFLAGLLFERYLTWIFVGNALSTACAMALILAFVKVRRSERSDLLPPEEPAAEEPAEEQAETRGTIRVLLRRPYLLLFFGATFLIAFVYSQVNFTLPLQLTRLYATGGTTLYGTLMSVTAVYVVVLTPLVVAATRRFAALANQIAAALLYAVGFGAIGYLRTFPLYLAAALVWTVGEVLFATNMYVYVANHSPRSHRGRMSSILPLVMQAGFALNPPVVGSYLTDHSLESTWPLMFFVGLGGATVLLLLALLERRRTAIRPLAAGDAHTGTLQEGPKSGPD